MSKLSWRLYRCVTIPQSWFSGLLGVSVDTVPAKLEEKLRDEFGPFAPRLRIWWAKTSDSGFGATQGEESSSPGHVTVGIECQAYDLTVKKVPCSGLCSVDPMVPQDVDRVDGALESELNRWGITVEFKDFDWKSEFNLTGQE